MSNSNSRGFFRGAVHELREVQWPTRKRALEVSAITLVFVALSTVFLMLLDAGVHKALYWGEAARPTIEAVDQNGNPINITTDENGNITLDPSSLEALQSQEPAVETTTTEPVIDTTTTENTDVEVTPDGDAVIEDVAPEATIEAITEPTSTDPVEPTEPVSEPNA